MALSKLNVSYMRNFSQAHLTCPYHFWHVHLFRSEIQELLCDVLVCCFTRSFITKEHFIYNVFL